MRDVLKELGIELKFGKTDSDRLFMLAEDVADLMEIISKSNIAYTIAGEIKDRIEMEMIDEKARDIINELKSKSL